MLACAKVDPDLVPFMTQQLSGLEEKANASENILNKLRRESQLQLAATEEHFTYIQMKYLMASTQ